MNEPGQVMPRSVSSSKILSEEAVKDSLGTGAGRERLKAHKRSSIELGSLALIRYLDHVLFRDVDPSLCRPWTREAVGWLDYEDGDHVRIVWERFAMPDPPNESKPRATGLVILKKAIVEMRQVISS